MIRQAGCRFGGVRGRRVLVHELVTQLSKLYARAGLQNSYPKQEVRFVYYTLAS
jgi:hypothetical protein